jgi:LysM domain
MNADRRLARYFLFVALAVGSLYLAGRNGLGSPPLTHPSRLPVWWSGVGPVVAVFSATRVALLATGSYWLVLLAVVAVTRAISPSRLARVVPGTPLLGVRRAARLALGASAFGSVLAGSSPLVFASTAPPTGPAPTLTNLAAPRPAIAPGAPIAATPAAPVPAAPTTAPAPAAPVPPAPTPAPVRAAPTVAGGPAPASGSVPTPPAPGAGSNSAPTPIKQTPPSPAQTPVPSNSPAQTPVAPVATPAPRPAGSPTSTARAGGAAAPQWIVRPGDNLWFIAERTLATAWGRSPTDRQVGAYWVSLIAANRSQLPDPSDPSLLFPGDVILLPAVPPAPPA